MVRIYPDLFDSARRYLTARGDYPHRCRVRTPLGVVAPTLYSSHDMSTVNEIFSRQDYRVGRELEVAVDIGSNIGISALYFLTRNATARAFLFEPDPKNTMRVRATLAEFEGRYRLEEVAIAVADGTASFATEDSGRYGTLRVDESAPDTTLITVRTRAINAVLREILRDQERIDVLKIDTEGSEIDLVTAIEPDVLDRISTIYYETDAPAPLHQDRFGFRYSCQTNRLTADGR
jgi:FkbM family methyltransferase